MNTISFAKFDNFDNQPNFSSDPEPDEKTEDFSIILSNIFVTLQPPLVPVKSVVPDQKGGNFEIACEGASKQNFEAENSLDDTKLPILPEVERTPLFPPQAELSTDLPTVPTLWAGNQGIRNRLNGYKTELKPNEPFPTQNNTVLRAENNPNTEKSDLANMALIKQAQKPETLTVLPQSLRTVTESLKAVQTKSEIISPPPPITGSTIGGDNSTPADFETAKDSIDTIVLKPNFVDNKLTGFNLIPNEIQSKLGTFETSQKSSEPVEKIIDPLKQDSASRLEEIFQNLNTGEKEQPKGEIKKTENEFNVSVNFDKFLENVSKDQKTVETVQSNQADPAKIAEQINPQLLELAALTDRKNEKQTLKMRLHPAELGTVEIKLERNSSGTLNAYFQTETEGAREALTNNLDQLRDSLQNAGWQIGQMEITYGSLSSTANQHRENASRQSESVENHNLDRSSEKPDDSDQNSSNRLLSLLA